MVLSTHPYMRGKYKYFFKASAARVHLVSRSPSLPPCLPCFGGSSHYVHLFLLAKRRNVSTIFSKRERGRSVMVSSLCLRFLFLHEWMCTTAVTAFFCSGLFLACTMKVLSCYTAECMYTEVRAESVGPRPHRSPSPTRTLYQYHSSVSVFVRNSMYSRCTCSVLMLLSLPFNLGWPHSCTALQNKRGGPRSKRQGRPAGHLPERLCVRGMVPLARPLHRV